MRDGYAFVRQEPPWLRGQSYAPTCMWASLCCAPATACAPNPCTSIIVHCPKLHTIKICPAQGEAFVRQLQGDFIADYSIWLLIKPRVPLIVPRPVYRVGE